MTEYLLAAGVALLASGLTLFSGFGLGTLLMPVLALLFPLPVAIAATAVVHLANNLFKLWLVGRNASRPVVLRFGIPAGVAAVAGAATLGLLADLPPFARYEFLGELHEVRAIGLVVGLLIVLFALLELLPGERLTFAPRWLVPGGLLSGFFGGLSGNQGALRAAFLIRSGLDKNAFVGTSVVCSVIVDLLRLAVYGAAFAPHAVADVDATFAGLVTVAIVAAFTGAWLGVRLLEKVTLRFVQLAVAVVMGLIGSALAAGLV